MKNEGPDYRPEQLLREWLEETDAERARDLLESLARHAESVVRRIVAFKLSGIADSSGRLHADVEDVSQNALCQLLARLERVKQGEGAIAMRDFTAYAAVTAYNACHSFFRAKRPAWLSLSMKIRYAATHSPKFALWTTTEGAEVCGLNSQKGQRPLGDAATLSHACDALRAHMDMSSLPVAELMEQILKAGRAPLVLESLVDRAAELSGVDEERTQPLVELRDKAPAIDAQLVQRNYIRTVWREIGTLPLEHRRALLLNLNDAAGGDIRLFDALGIASVRQIAVVLEMDPLEFARLWNDLPLDDAQLAQFLGISRQNVANRRSTARKRLVRRLEEAEREF